MTTVGDGDGVLGDRAGPRRDPAGDGAGARAPTRCWCARCAPASAAAPRRWCSRGRVPESQYAAMRAPFQEGDFPGPVKYGYLNVGVVERGPADLVGRTVFCLYPHQTSYVVPASAVTVVPDGVPPARAVLAGTVETAVNALWDARPLVGDRVAVVGAGMVGCCVARLLAGIPGVDRDAGRRGRVPRAGGRSARGAASPRPMTRPATCDLVVHTSGTSAGPADLARPAGAGRRGGRAAAGTATRRSPSSSAAPSTRGGWRSGPARSARSPRPGGAGVRTPSGWRWPSTCCATRRSTCC